MSNGPTYLNEMDALLSQTINRIADESPTLKGHGVLSSQRNGKGWSMSSQTNVYPKLDIPDLIATMDRFKEEGVKIDNQLLDALVDIVNRSPYTVNQWAQMLEIPIIDFINVCHRTSPITNTFRDKVSNFFNKFRDRERVEWSDIPPKKG